MRQGGISFTYRSNLFIALFLSTGERLTHMVYLDGYNGVLNRAELSPHVHFDYVAMYLFMRNMKRVIPMPAFVKRLIGHTMSNCAICH